MRSLARWRIPVLPLLGVLALAAFPSLAAADATTPASAVTTDAITGQADASSLTPEAVCAPVADQPTCYAEVLAGTSDGVPVHPLLAPAVSPDRTLSTATGPMDLLSPLDSVSPLSEPAAAPQPQAGTPAYMQQAYDVSYLSQNAGGTQTVGIVDAYGDPTAASDLATYRSEFGLPACTTANGCFDKVDSSGGTNYPAAPTGDAAGWRTETSLDLDAVSALCPNCHILLVQSTGSWADMEAAEAEAHTLRATEISNSWGGLTSSTAGLASAFTFPGVATVASSGDDGYWGSGLAAYPASVPGVTDAGGTELDRTTAPTARGYQELGWSDAGSGCDLSQAKPSYQTDSGCAGRAGSDISADASPNTGLTIYDSADGGWMLVGGTSLASPLIAAYYALLGGPSALSPAAPAWGYSHASALNDPTAMDDGPNGQCATTIAYICTAGPGYDGPTGIGSISGDVVKGAPGIGGPGLDAQGNTTDATSVAGTTMALQGGVYPNGLDTTYHWEYGTTTAYGQSTATVDAGAGTGPVLTTAQTLTSLSPTTTYHYRLVATNSDGTTYGYDDTTTTTVADPPVNAVAPSITGTPIQGGTVSVAVGTWSPAATSYAYQWQRNTGSGFVNIAGATASSYELGVADGGATLQVVVTASNSSGSQSATSAAVTVLSGAPANTTAPVVNVTDGGLQRTDTATAGVGTWSPSASSYTYQWQRCLDDACSNITGATGDSYVLAQADEGSRVQVVVTAVNAYGQTAATTAAVGPIVADAPKNSTVPSISGAAGLGTVLTAAAGAWTPAGSTFSYQWQRSSGTGGFTNIGGATSATYTLAAADVGHTVRVTVTATNVDGSASAPSAATAIVTQPPQSISGPGAPTGTLMDTYTLTAGSGTWDGTQTSLSYSWLRCGATATAVTPSCVTIGSGPSLVLTADDVGDTIAFAVTATSPAGSTTVDSPLTAAVTGRHLINSVAPSISGDTHIPQTLTANPGTWSVPTTAISYAWQRCDSSGNNCSQVATGSTYKLSAADEGHTIMIVATATSPGQTTTASSAPVTVLDQPTPQNTVAPSITGTAIRTSTLHATTGTWTNSPSSFAYQWQRCDSSGGNCVNIPGAAAATHLLTVADEGSTITVVVIATNADGSVAASAAPTAPVAAFPAVNTHIPVIGGTAQQGDTVTMSRQTWSAPSDVIYVIAWQRCDASGDNCVASPTSHAANYAVAAADVGDTLRAQSIAITPDGTVTATSAPTAVVLPAAPHSTTAPQLSTDPGKVGDVITVHPGTWTGATLTSDVTQVMRCTSSCEATSSAPNASTYTIVTADVGSVLRVEETASNAGGSTTVWSSHYVGPVSSATKASVATTASAVLGHGQAPVRTAQGVPLAIARLAPSAGIASAGAASAGRVLKLRRSRGVRGPLRVWMTPVTSLGGQAPIEVAVTMHGAKAAVRLPASMTGKVLVVVTKTHRR